MRATEIIRNLLDIIDAIDCSRDSMDQSGSISSTESEPIITGVDTNRFKHIFAMLDAERSTDVMYDNSPNQVVADINSVTKDAGGGVNGPKNSSDIRSDSVSMYPNYGAR